MDFQEIRYEVADRVLTITLHRPDRLNAWTTTMQGELIEALDRADADDEVRAIVVTGAGRGFCAGADLQAGGATFDWRERGRSTFSGADADEVPRDGGGTFTLRAFRCTKPLVAAINGPAVGVGITMTLPFDVRIAADDARMGFVFARRGIVPEACSSWFLPRIVGIARAMSGSPPAGCSAPRRRSRAGSSVASTRAASCSTPPTSWRARSPTTPRRSPSRSPAG
jgi:enoyl-CoA hydratase/carnithine racemase